MIAFFFGSPLRGIESREKCTQVNEAGVLESMKCVSLRARGSRWIKGTILARNQDSGMQTVGEEKEVWTRSRKLGLPPPATAGVAGQHELLPGGSGTVPAPSFSPAPQMSSLLSKGLKRNTEKRRCGEEGGPG